MRTDRWYHGGIAGLHPGDNLLPSPPHVTDGCPLCVARSEGRTMTVGEYRVWLRQFGEQATHILSMLHGATDTELLDPPSEQDGVYITTDKLYGAWYAARSGHGDLYEVQPCGPLNMSDTDHFPSAVVPKAKIIRVLRRRVWLTRQERRELDRRWAKADEKASRARGSDDVRSQRGR